MRTFLICHEEELLNREILPRWLASFSELGGILVLRETRKQKQRRIQREFRRVGPLRFMDVVAFRLYYRFFLSAADDGWRRKRAAELARRYAEVPATVPILVSSSPNSSQARDFIHHAAPDVMIARCKVILKEEIFSTPRRGTLVMHPGICPEYRNAHGCFWALANRDLTRVGMTLLRIDRGVDTGPIFGHYRCSYDERRESHIVIQERTVFDNLDVLRAQLEAIVNDQAVPVDVSGRSSAAWGQPWLTKYLAWKWAARQTMIISLLYHDVVANGELASSGFPQADAAIYKLTRPEFERHLEAIAHDVQSREVTLLNSRQQKIPDRALLFTFDDGGVSSMVIADLLEARGWRGHFFITTDYIGRDGFLTASQIRELHGRGHLIGSHSCSHPPRISHCTAAELDREWRESVRVLSNCLGEKVVVGSVPGGFYARRVAQAARNAGIEVLFTSEPASWIRTTDDCLIVGRYSIQQGTSARTAARIARGDAAPRLRQFIYWNAKKGLKRIGGNYYVALRKKLLRDRSA